MPHVSVKCYPGKTEEQKKALAEAILKDVVEIFGNAERSISISVEDIAKEEWKEKVYDPEIVEKKELLYKTPGYTME